jgi:sarcosine oxidase subunit beta
VDRRAEVLIVGGGVVGTCLAWCLARRGVDGIVVLDLDLAGVYASSELNAGGARATWWQPVNIETCHVTLEFFAEHAAELGFQRRGYLWLYDDPELHARALAHRSLQNRLGLAVEALEVGDVSERFPILDRHLDELVGATFSAHDGLVNPNAVRAWYRSRAEEQGVTFLNRHYANGVVTDRVAGEAGSLRRVSAVDVIEVSRGDPTDEDGVVRRILTTHGVPPDVAIAHGRVHCDTVVNCLGAWSPVFSSKIGIADVTEPVRRQIALVGVQPGRDAPDVDPDALGMIVDPSGLYFHPEGAHVLAGYSTPSEAPGFDFSYDGEAFFERELWPRLAHRASLFERCGHVRGWAGLYAVTPDCSGIAGPVAGFANLYEAHSFTGRGVMQSYGVGDAMAERITTGRFGAIDLSPLHRARFRDPARWVTEELHI